MDRFTRNRAVVNINGVRKIYSRNREAEEQEAVDTSFEEDLSDMNVSANDMEELTANASAMSIEGEIFHDMFGLNKYSLNYM